MFFFLPRRTGDRLVLKWWVKALRGCRLFSVSVIERGRKEGEAEQQRGAERHLGRGRVLGTSCLVFIEERCDPPPPPPPPSLLLLLDCLGRWKLRETD